MKKKDILILYKAKWSFLLIISFNLLTSLILPLQLICVENILSIIDNTIDFGFVAFYVCGYLVLAIINILKTSVVNILKLRLKHSLQISTASMLFNELEMKD